MKIRTISHNKKSYTSKAKLQMRAIKKGVRKLRTLSTRKSYIAPLILVFSLSFMKKLLPKYFDSEWSYAQFRVPDGKALCAFNDDGTTLIAVTTDGSYYLADIPRKKGDCVQREIKKLT